MSISLVHPATEMMTPQVQNSAHLTSSKKIIIFGEALVDIFPDKSVLGGAPFNVSRHLKAFGEHPVLITRLGNDALGKSIMDALSQREMDSIGIQCSNRHPTGKVLVHAEHTTHRFEIPPAQAYDFIHPGVARATTLHSNPALIYFGTLAQRSEVSRRALKSILRSSGALKFLDVNLRFPWYGETGIRESLQFANIVKVNDIELGMLAEMLEIKGNSPQAQAQNLMNRFAIDQFVVTCGEKGAWQISKDDNLVESTNVALPENIVDTVGAGDAFAAVYILGTLQKWPIQKTLARANLFAGAICEIRGAVPDHTDFYNRFAEEWSA